MGKPTLYSTLLSANGRKVQATCQALGIQPEIIETNVYSGEGEAQAYLGINALGQIPTLVDDRFVLMESNAIMIYLSENYADRALYSSNPRIRAEINRWLFWESSQWQPHLSRIMVRHVGHRLLPNIYPKPNEEPDWEDEPFLRQISLLESHLCNRHWLVEERLTLADISVAGMTTYFTISHFPFVQYPSISAWYKRLSETEAWRMTQHALYNT